jgi:spore maturation protein CgeB
MRTLLVGNFTEAPFVNNLLPVVRAFGRVDDTHVVEPRFIEGFVPTGGARPAVLPPEAVRNAIARFTPDVVVCIGGGIYLAPESRATLPRTTVVAGFALSDPLGLTASLMIAPHFDLYYTQDPQSVLDYEIRGIHVRRCDSATDGELYRPLGLPKKEDLMFFGKWTPLRDRTIGALAERFRVALYAHAGDTRWSIPARPPAASPDALCRAVNEARVALEFAAIDDAPPGLTGRARISNRAQIASACEVPVFTDPSDSLGDFFEAGKEIEVYRSFGELVDKVSVLLADEPRRAEMGRRARARVLRDQTWDSRVAMFRRDVDELARSRPDR